MEVAASPPPTAVRRGGATSTPPPPPPPSTTIGDIEALRLAATSRWFTVEEVWSILREYQTRYHWPLAEEPPSNPTSKY